MTTLQLYYKSPSGCDYLLAIPDRSLSFPSAEYVRSVITKAGIKKGLNSIPVVIDARHLQAADYTSAKGMKLLMSDFNNRNQPIIFTNLKKSVIKTLHGVDSKSFIYCKNSDDLNEILKQCSTKNNTISIDVELKNPQNLTKL